MNASILQPGTPFPEVTTPKHGGGTVNLKETADNSNWKLVVVYRGKHCPLCTRYLQELNELLPQFEEIGVEIVAVSADSKERADAQLAEVKPAYNVGYDLTIEQMNTLGLLISGPRNGINVERPFAEPGAFVINEEGNLQIIDVSNVPFARPSLSSLIMGIRYLRGLDEKPPVNGTYAA